MTVPIKIHHLFSNLPSARKKEVFRTLHRTREVRIERIVSRGQSTPRGRWLCEPASEWVMVLEGRARLAFRGKRGTADLKAGDYVFIPARTAHRVEWTPGNRRTVWLAFHICERGGRGKDGT